MALLWSHDVEVEIQNFSQRHINDVTIVPRNKTTTWKFSGFYGHPNPTKRHEGWALLRHLKFLDPDP